MTSSALPDSVTVPPTIVPSERFQDSAPSASVVPVFVSVPTRLIVPPVGLKVPKAAAVNRPPRFTVELLVLIVPAFDHWDDGLPKLRVAPVTLIVEPAA